MSILVSIGCTRASRAAERSAGRVVPATASTDRGAPATLAADRSGMLASRHYVAADDAARIALTTGQLCSAEALPGQACQDGSLIGPVGRSRVVRIGAPDLRSVAQIFGPSRKGGG